MFVVQSEFFRMFTKQYFMWKIVIYSIRVDYILKYKKVCMQNVLNIIDPIQNLYKKMYCMNQKKFVGMKLNEFTGLIQS